MLVSHDLAVVAHLCETIGVMQNGRLVEEIAVDSLLADKTENPYTRHLYSIALNNDLVFEEAGNS